MQVTHRVTSRTSVQTLPQPKTAALRHQIQLVTVQPVLVQAIINPKWGMEEQQTPLPPRTCSSPGPAEEPCWSFDVRVAMLMVTLAGAVILLLLYRLFQLRHRLQLARARHALEYHGFFHTATYTLKHPDPCLDLPAKSGMVPETTVTVQTSTVVPPTTITPLPPPQVTSPPPLPLPPPPALPPPPLRPSSLPPTPPVLAFPLPLPMIHTTPPSPHLSWGACSDADVYTRIGAIRSSRLSSISNQSKVILFEHSSF